MKKILGIVNGIFISILLFGVQFFTFYFLSTNDINYNYSKPLFYISSGVFVLGSLFLLILLRKRRYLSITQFSFTILFTVSFHVLLNNIMNYNIHSSTWDSDDDHFTVNFSAGNQGRLYLYAKINNKKGYFLFDSGAEISTANEKILPENHVKIGSATIIDAKKITQKKQVVQLDSFRLGHIKIKDIKMYPEDSLSWSDSKGHFFKQDSVIGIIGNNIISNYVWDFNMLEKTVTISKSKNYCRDFPDSTAIDLTRVNNNWSLPVLINNTQKELKLDFGCSSALVICDTISNKDKFTFKDLTSTQNSMSALNHLDPNKKSYSEISFVDVSFGNNNFKRVKCVEKAESNLFGIPFIWSFERVILDFNHDKAYFISRSDSVGKLGAVNISKNFWANSIAIALNINGKAEVALRNNIKMPIKWITHEGDTLNREYIIYGNVIFYGGKKNLNTNNHLIDSIVSFDSLILPNGLKNYGSYTIDCNEKYFSE